MNSITEQERLKALASYKVREQEHSFVKMCYEYQWVEPFDWASWMQTDEADQLRDDPKVLSRSTRCRFLFCPWNYAVTIGYDRTSRPAIVAMKSRGSN